jgi:transcriptional regulator with XRE-family HTH domain
MNMMYGVVATGTSATSDLAGFPHWPHVTVTGTVVQVPRIECDLAGMDASPLPEAVRLVKRIQDGLGLTIGQTAKALGCSRQAVHGWMRGKRIDPDNLSNLRELAAWATEWSTPHPERRQASDLLDPTFLEKLGRAGASSAKGRTMWEKYILRPTGTSDWEAVPSTDAITRKIGAHPVSATERAHRRAHNLGALNIDAHL